MKLIIQSLKIIVLLVPFFLVSDVYGADYYVSVTGNDSSNGSELQPFKTFTKSISVLNPGDNLFIYGGNYISPLVVNKSGSDGSPIRIKPVPGQNVVVDSSANRTASITGSYIEVSGLKFINGGWTCLDLSGQNILIDSVEVTGCQSHGIIAFGRYITVRNSKIFETVKENVDRSGGWGSGLKVERGAMDVIYEHNEVFHNHGEGIATTMGKNVVIRNNRVYDNFSVNIYIDNSSNVRVENNFSTCSPSALQFYRDGQPAAGILIGEESYSGWGAQLSDLVIVNNVQFGCSGINFYGAEVSPGGLVNSLIAHNTIWNVYNNGRAVNISNEQNNSNIKIMNNIAAGAISTGQGISVSNNLTSTTFATIPTYNVDSFKLATNASAINGGVDVGVNTDFEGKQRDGNPDIGAFEFDGLIVGSTTIPSQIPTTPPVLLGDLNSDRTVNNADYNIFLNDYDQTNTVADINRDGRADIFDYNILVENYGKSI